nr:hypothetical protein BaRGS_021199 [Batillaria attramentaria]
MIPMNVLILHCTGLDPAEPYFVHLDNDMRLDKSDAVFVDIMHTDGEAFAVTKGYGMADALGDVDFYPNGGIDQPGCVDDVRAGIFGLLTGGNGLQCSHSRAHMYFIESINSHCKFRSRPCADWGTYERGDCHTCPSSGCPVMGDEADKTSARGSFYLTTTPTAPFCGQEYHVQVKLSDTPVHANGRLNITLLGENDSQEGEFSRDNEDFRANETLSHVIAVNKLHGAVHGVRLKYHSHSGDTHVFIHRVFVEDLDTETR